MLDEIRWIQPYRPGQDLILMNASELVVRSAEAFLPLQREDGSFPSGHNGPYYDDELPLRNTAHLLILMLGAHRASADEQYREAALRALDYVTASERRPMGATWWLRKKPEKDFSNGVIGQAWVIEALAFAADVLQKQELNSLAEEVFLLHPFDADRGRWRVVNVDGSHAPVDMTFNHQLWFAAAGSYLMHHEDIALRVRRFMDTLDSNLGLYENGLVVHALGGLRNSALPLRRRLKQAVKSRLTGQGRPNHADPVLNKAIGYHAFNTYAFGMLFDNLPDHAFWQSTTFSRMLEFLQTGWYRDGLDYYTPDPAHATARQLPFNRFGYAYNPPGIEVAYTIKTFKAHFGDSHAALMDEWLDRQQVKTLDPQTSLMTRNTDDAATLSARVYEAVRLLG